MKNLALSTIAFLLLTVTGCKKDDKDDSTTVNPTTVSNMLISGTWKIAYYYHSNNDQTAIFAAYKFTFTTGGTVAASNDLLSIPGTWSVAADSGKTKLILVFGPPDEFQELNEDWEVLEKTSTRIKLQHVSGGGGGTDLLTFDLI